MNEAGRELVQRYSPGSTAQQLSVPADLPERGKPTEEYAAEQARVLAS